MNSTCPGVADGAFLQSVLGFVDCQAQMIGAQGYQALAAPGSPLSLLLTGMLTLFVAFWGYRLLLGEAPSVRDGVVAFAKIGIVLALATSWPAYRTLVYDVAFNGPAELVSEVGKPAGIPSADGGLIERLGQVDSSFLILGQLGPGPVNLASRVRNVGGRNVLVTEPVAEPPSVFGAFALGTARLTFLTATIAGFASVRLIAGLLLALGPLFIAFLLFEGTRGLFEGWIRALAAAAIGAVAVTMLLGVELALIEPWLASLIAQRQAELPIGGAATELLVVALGFAFGLVGGLGMAARIMIGFRLPGPWRIASQQFAANLRETATARATGMERRSQPANEQLSRAAVISESVVNMQRRESVGVRAVGAPSRNASQSPPRDLPQPTHSPLGQGNRRRTQSRVSASAGRRDGRQ
ncbi:type IV secretion system protein [Sphingomonas sp.]|jgi:type IV secretion system protein VirB6|uniref:type IV secretion system protein n=1 Tax=Sphingomonas sp. TaxID=28214 RepID=UPI002EDAACEF